MPPDPRLVKNPSIIIEDVQRESNTQMSIKRESKSFEENQIGSFMRHKTISKESSVENFPVVDVQVPIPLE